MNSSLRLAVLLTLGVTLAGCATTGGDSQKIIHLMKNSTPLNGLWYGQIRCGDGAISNISLNIQGQPSGKLTGVNTVSQLGGFKANGTYSFDGMYEQDGEFSFKPERWLRSSGAQPMYALKGMADNIEQPTRFSGKVPECAGTFTLGREMIRSETVAEPAIKQQGEYKLPLSIKNHDANGLEDAGLFDDALKKLGFMPVAISRTEVNGKGKKSTRSNSEYPLIFVSPATNDPSFIGYKVQYAEKDGEGYLLVSRTIYRQVGNDSRFMETRIVSINKIGKRDMNKVAFLTSDFIGADSASCWVGTPKTLLKDESARQNNLVALLPKISKGKKVPCKGISSGADSCRVWPAEQTQSGIWTVDAQGQLNEANSQGLVCAQYVVDGC